MMTAFANLLIQPIFEPQAWDLSKVSRIASEQNSIMDDGDTRDLQIHCANSDPLSFHPQIDFSTFSIPGKNNPRSKQIDTIVQFRIRSNLLVRILETIDHCHPAAQLFFYIHNCRRSFLIGCK